jgi:Phage Tail Collar Domain
MTDTAGTGRASPDALTDVPIGTIVPYAGDCGNMGVVGALGRNGWMPCDGSSLLVDSYPELFAVIQVNFGGEFNSSGIPVKYYLPDLSNQFIRGVNLTATDKATGRTVDPDAAERLAIHPHGNTGNRVGSLQFSATGVPFTPFTTEQRGSHQHRAEHLTDKNQWVYGGASFDQARNTGDAATLKDAGDHPHRVDQGGDAETRPANVSLFFIIKAF